MLLRYFGKRGLVSLLVVSLMLAGGSAWAVHDCCGHPSGSNESADSGTNESPSDGECVCICCQSETAISLLPGTSFRSVSWWPVGDVEAFAVSRFETDIFRPPLA